MEPPSRCTGCGQALTAEQREAGDLRQRVWYGEVTAALHPGCVREQLRFVFDGGAGRVVMAGARE